MITEEMKIKEEQKIEELVRSGKAKRVSIDILEKFDNINLTDDNKMLTEDILYNYKEYLQLINTLKEYKTPFIEVLKEKEILRNQALEGVNQLVIDVFMKAGVPSATNQLIEDKRYNLSYTQNDFITSHKRMLLGVYGKESTEDGIRTRNLSYVGKKGENGPEIDYIPLDYKDIEIAIDYLLKLYNDDTIKTESDILIKPIVMHGLIAALQMFKDGNTRLARIYENIMLWDLSNNICNYEDNPTLYMSEAIYKNDDRSFYRHLISDIAINPNLKTINRWINYNLLSIEKQIYLNRDKIAEIYPSMQKKMR